MRRLFLSAAVMLLTIAATAQSISVAESPKRPGDPIRYTITLDGPVKGTVTTIYVSFKLTTKAHDNQKGLQGNFDLSKFTVSSPTEYRIDDVVPGVMSGTYLLSAIQFRTADGDTRNYSFPEDFKQENKVVIDNPAKNIFPNIKSVLPSH